MSDSVTESESDTQETYVLEHTGLTQPIVCYNSPRSEARLQERLEQIRQETPYYMIPYYIPEHTGLTPEPSQHEEEPEATRTDIGFDCDAMQKSYKSKREASCKMEEEINALEKAEHYGDYDGEIISGTDSDTEESEDPDASRKKARMQAIRAYGKVAEDFREALDVFDEAGENCDRLFRRLKAMKEYVDMNPRCASTSRLVWSLLIPPKKSCLHTTTTTTTMDAFGGGPSLYLDSQMDGILGAGATSGVKREVDPYPPFNLPFSMAPTQSVDQAIARADHGTLMRVGNATYMQLYEWAKNLKTMNDNQTVMINHYSKLIAQQQSTTGYHHGFPLTPSASGSTTPNPFPIPPPSSSSTPPAAAPINSQAAAYTSIPAAPQPMAQPSKAAHPLVKFWVKTDWTTGSDNKADQGTVKVKAEPVPDPTIDPSTSDKKKATKSKPKVPGEATNQKISFLEDEHGRFPHKDRLDMISKAYYDLLTDLANILGEFFPHTWSVVGDRFRTYVINTLYNKFIEFRLGDDFWKVLEYCSAKFTDWARSGMPHAVKAQKAELKRKRRAERESRSKAGPPAGADIHNVDEDEDDTPSTKNHFLNEDSSAHLTVTQSPTDEARRLQARLVREETQRECAGWIKPIHDGDAKLYSALGAYDSLFGGCGRWMVLNLSFPSAISTVPVELRSFAPTRHLQATKERGRGMTALAWRSVYQDGRRASPDSSSSVTCAQPIRGPSLTTPTLSFSYRIALTDPAHGSNGVVATIPYKLGKIQTPRWRRLKPYCGNTSTPRERSRDRDIHSRMGSRDEVHGRQLHLDHDVYQENTDRIMIIHLTYKAQLAFGIDPNPLGGGDTFRLHPRRGLLVVMSNGLVTWGAGAGRASVDKALARMVRGMKRLVGCIDDCIDFKVDTTLGSMVKPRGAGTQSTARRVSPEVAESLSATSFVRSASTTAYSRVYILLDAYTLPSKLYTRIYAIPQLKTRPAKRIYTTMSDRDGFLGLLPNSEDTARSSSPADFRVGIETKPCKTCKAEMAVYGAFVNCYACREKNKVKNREKEARKRELRRLRDAAAAAALGANVDDVENAAPAANGGEKKGESVGKKVKKAKEENVVLRERKNLAELEGEEREVALRMMKFHVQRLVKRKGSADPYVRPTEKSAGTEYLDASTLYAALKAHIAEKPKKLNFKGFHVMVAAEEEDHKKHLERIVKDLRKVVKLPFDHSEPIHKYRNKTYTMRGETYNCTCKGYVTVVPPTPSPSLPSSSSSSSSISPSSSSSSLERPPSKKPKLSTSGGSLMEYMRSLKTAKQEEEEREKAEKAALKAKQNAENAAAAAANVAPERRRVECGGTVKVEVKEDRSHPFGIVGLKWLPCYNDSQKGNRCLTVSILAIVVPSSKVFGNLDSAVLSLSRPDTVTLTIRRTGDTMWSNHRFCASAAGVRELTRDTLARGLLVSVFRWSSIVSLQDCPFPLRPLSIFRRLRTFGSLVRSSPLPLLLDHRPCVLDYAFLSLYVPSRFGLTFPLNGVASEPQHRVDAGASFPRPATMGGTTHTWDGVPQPNVPVLLQADIIIPRPARRSISPSLCFGHLDDNRGSLILGNTQGPSVFTLAIIDRWPIDLRVRTSPHSHSLTPLNRACFYRSTPVAQVHISYVSQMISPELRWLAFRSLVSYYERCSQRKRIRRQKDDVGGASTERSAELPLSLSHPVGTLTVALVQRPIWQYEPILNRSPTAILLSVRLCSSTSQTIHIPSISQSVDLGNRDVVLGVLMLHVLSSWEPSPGKYSTTYVLARFSLPLSLRDRLPAYRIHVH
ncbi:hypothetical protein NMY22_g14634 [Coprinellus aureogranulatus]|nr:hypothetical protein NMY22_g14634 [Coprinellus aureogranulatus]